MSLLQPIDPNELDQIVFDRVAGSTDVAALLAEWEAASSSVVFASELDFDTRSRWPVLPVLALRNSNRSQFVRSWDLMTYDWFIYDEPLQLYLRINRVTPLLQSLYAAPLAYTTSVGIIKEIETVPSGERYDPVLGLRYKYLRINMKISQ